MVGGMGSLMACSSTEEAMVSVSAEDGAAPASSGQWLMPAESAPHARTFMSWPPLDGVWEGEDGPAVQNDIAAIARSVADFEPVVLLAAPEQAKAAQRACGSGVDVIPIETDDLWMRDSGPTFVVGASGLAGIDFHFNGWGGKQEHARDAQVAASLLSRIGVTRIDAPITAEGGSLEVDGAGTLMATESSLVNPNRNPGLSRDAIEAALKNLTGVTQVIWLQGVRGRDITDYHVDSLARFADPGVVLLSQPPEADDVWARAYRQARGVLQQATDARGRELEIIEVPEPDLNNLGGRGEEFLGSYANYYVVNGGVLVPRFGDRRADANAGSIIGELHPGREIVPIEIDIVAEGGGGIHCATQQEPAV
ncbi:MAG: agmatine deiminase family protein [Actinomycetia bacterium]|nr:agmatine deiminase family protein [Actinomycetes bacterium]MCH9761616.1 agmatine deiminase family protein [Actinomycetes bacterium]